MIAATRVVDWGEASVLVAFGLLLAAFCIASQRVQLIFGAIACLLLYALNTWLVTRRMLLLRWEKMDRSVIPRVSWQ